MPSSNSAGALFGSGSQLKKLLAQGSTLDPSRSEERQNIREFARPATVKQDFLCGGVMRCPKSWGYPKSSKF